MTNLPEGANYRKDAPWNEIELPIFYNIDISIEDAIVVTAVPTEEQMNDIIIERKKNIVKLVKSTLNNHVNIININEY